MNKYQPDINLTDHVAIVTGGGAGIGRAIALSLASVGANIVIADRIPERGAEVVQRVTEMGREALALTTDMSDSSQVENMVAAAMAHFGRIDMLVNNVGGVRPKPFAEQSESSWRRLIDLNFVSMLAATSAVIPHLIAGGRGGSILNISSIEASRAAPQFAVYAACKAAMLNFTRTMALELADHHIRVNAIAPDYTVTPGLRGNVSGPVDPATWIQPSELDEQATAKRIPLGRSGLDSECGQAAVYLCSGMSSYVTGTVLPVDGGTWASAGWLRNNDGKWTLNGGR